MQLEECIASGNSQKANDGEVAVKNSWPTRATTSSRRLKR